MNAQLLTIIDVGPRVVGLYGVGARMKRGEAVDDVGAQVDVNVRRHVLALATTGKRCKLLLKVRSGSNPSFYVVFESVPMHVNVCSMTQIDRYCNCQRVLRILFDLSHEATKVCFK